MSNKGRDVFTSEYFSKSLRWLTDLGAAEVARIAKVQFRAWIKKNGVKVYGNLSDKGWGWDYVETAHDSHYAILIDIKPINPKEDYKDETNPETGEHIHSTTHEVPELLKEPVKDLLKKGYPFKTAVDLLKAIEGPLSIIIEERDRYRDALNCVSRADYRGPMPWVMMIARNALELENESGCILTEDKKHSER